MFLSFREILIFFSVALSYKGIEAINPIDSTGGSSDNKVGGIEAFSGDNNKIIFQKTAATPQITKEQVLPITTKIFGNKGKTLLETSQNQIAVAFTCALILNSCDKMQSSLDELHNGINNTKQIPTTINTLNLAIRRFITPGSKICGVETHNKDIQRQVAEINEKGKANLKIEDIDHHTLGEFLGIINIYGSLTKGFSEEMERKWHNMLKIILKKPDGKIDEIVTPITGVARMLAICNTTNNDQFIKLPSYNGDANKKPNLKKPFLEYYDDSSKMFTDFKHHMKISAESIASLLAILKDPNDRKKVTELLMYLLMQPNNLGKFQKEFREWIPDDSYYSKDKNGTLFDLNNIFSLSDGSMLQYDQFAKMLNPSLELSSLPIEDKTSDPGDKKTDQQEKKPFEVEIDKIIESLDSTITQLKKMLPPEGESSHASTDGSTGGTGEKNVDIKGVKEDVKNVINSSEDKIRAFLNSLYDGKIDEQEVKDLENLDNVNEDLKKAINEFIETYNFYKAKNNTLFDESNDNFPESNEEILKKLFQDYKKDNNDFKKAIISIVAHNLTKQGGIPGMKSFTGLLASDGALIRKRNFIPSRSWISSNINISSYEDAKRKLDSALKDSSSNPLDNLPNSISSIADPDSIKQAITAIEAQKSALESLKNKIKDMKQGEKEDMNQGEQESRDEQENKGFIISIIRNIVDYILKKFGIVEQKILNIFSSCFKYRLL